MFEFWLKYDKYDVECNDDSFICNDDRIDDICWFVCYVWDIDDWCLVDVVFMCRYISLGM